MLRLELGPSRVFTGMLIMVHGLSIALIGFSPLPVWMAVFLASVVLVSVRRSVRVHGLKSHPDAIRILWPKEDGIWEVITAEGVPHEAQLLSGSYVSPYLTVLNFRMPGKFRRINVVILPDGIEQEVFRQLRVWLKWGSPLPKTGNDTASMGHNT